MILPFCRTDLAMEALNANISEADVLGENLGIISESGDIEGFSFTSVEVLNDKGEKKIGKPKGKYDTICIDSLLRREEDAFLRACKACSERISAMLPNTDDALVIGLGNRNITPDAVGPMTSDYLLATRHLILQNISYFANWRSVSVISPGVLGQTGIEAQEFLKGTIDAIKPSVVIAVDALAASDPDRLCKTIQITNSGIVPGSGVQNARCALNEQTLGVPVIAVGAPTVIDANSLFSSYFNDKTAKMPDFPMFVTPRDIDKNVADLSRVIGYSINMALQSGLTPSDIDLYLS